MDQPSRSGEGIFEGEPVLPPLGDLLRRMPMALLVIDDDGRTLWANDRFRRSFDLGHLELGAPGGEGRNCPDRPSVHNLRGRDGKIVETLVHCMPLPNARLLMIDETPGVAGAEVLRDLQARVTQLEHDSLTDRLTGAWNRRYLDQATPGELARSRRYRQPLSAAMIDIDHFKLVNDTFGHAAGDGVLQELVAVVRACVRESDVLVRWGGEEFLLLMPFTAHRPAAVAAENLRTAVAAHAFSVAGRVTISAGVAEHLQAEDAASFYTRADQALYRAKEGGRNRVEADARGASDAWAREESAEIVKLVWRDSYACGEPTIDAQHEELFRLANELIACSLRQAKDRGAFIAALEALLAHVARHFSDEETILEARGYAKLAQHKAAHGGLLRRAGALKEAALRGEANAGRVVEFLAHEVVAQHLLAADRDFYPLFSAG